MLKLITLHDLLVAALVLGLAALGIDYWVCRQRARNGQAAYEFLVKLQQEAQEKKQAEQPKQEPK